MELRCFIYFRSDWKLAVYFLDAVVQYLKPRDVLLLVEFSSQSPLPPQNE